MKRILQMITVFALVIAVTNAFAQGKAKIVFDELEHDFGNFKEAEGVQKTSFKFTNRGETPLVLNNVRASCGCTTPRWTKEPVAPGGEGEIIVSYDPKNRPGSFNKSVTVQSNAENSTVVLRITGSAQQREKTLAELYPRKVGALRVKTNHISFSRMKEKDIETKELELVNDTDSPVKVGFRSVPGHLTAKVEPETIPAHETGKLLVTYDAEKVNTFGFASHRIYLSLDGSNDYKSSIGISATIEEDFSNLTSEQLANAPVANYPEKAFDFGEMTQGEKKEHTFTLKNEGKSDLIIRNVRSSCGCTAVAPAKKVIAAGETAPIKVTFDSRGKRGRQSKSITVITNDPKNPTTTLRISSNVVTTTES
ncbi:DUF1573 domain-containing protein [Maribellus maritimus]|uniref:DUF1573 domain-containing protein n=1 Tax=Maribellus maritimus TaxID=2870838 RepID=UPI001EEC126B|nr:DUF1573 domain-containing protein [Maribellus maritimus]MCG6186066.1 DUF1573 domain-containing protein [Maribellus maritimus]